MNASDIETFILKQYLLEKEKFRDTINYESEKSCDIGKSVNFFCEDGYWRVGKKTNQNQWHASDECLYNNKLIINNADVVFWVRNEDMDIQLVTFLIAQHAEKLYGIDNEKFIKFLIDFYGLKQINDKWYFV